MKRFVTFTSDFGTRDSYVASVKLRILSEAPHCEVIDVTHEIPFFSPALALPPLVDIMRISPPETIHLCVVDPGVGSPRRPLAGEGQNAFFILPDNGLPLLLTEWVEGLVFYHMNSPEIFWGRGHRNLSGERSVCPGRRRPGRRKDDAKGYGPPGCNGFPNLLGRSTRVLRRSPSGLERRPFRQHSSRLLCPSPPGKGGHVTCRNCDSLCQEISGGPERIAGLSCQ